MTAAHLTAWRGVCDAQELDNMTTAVCVSRVVYFVGQVAGAHRGWCQRTNYADVRINAVAVTVRSPAVRAAHSSGTAAGLHFGYLTGQSRP